MIHLCPWHMSFSVIWISCITLPEQSLKEARVEFSQVQVGWHGRAFQGEETRWAKAWGSVIAEWVSRIIDNPLFLDLKVWGAGGADTVRARWWASLRATARSGLPCSPTFHWCVHVDCVSPWNVSSKWETPRLRAVVWSCQHSFVPTSYQNYFSHIYS